MKWTVDPAKRQRVMVDTDARNEADDQYAIVHALLTQIFDARFLMEDFYAKLSRFARKAD